MSVPAIVRSALGDAEVVERVSLGGDDELFVISDSTLIYRSDGLLSDESIEEYPHDADRVAVTEGRRKSKITLDYSLEGSEEFKVPTSAVDVVVHPVLAGVLSGNGVTEPGERVIQTFRFSELTVIVTSKRLVKHIGSAVWDEDFEEYRYEDVTGLTFESGSVATQVVLEVDGRPQRIKAPNDHATALRQRLQQAIFAVHDVDSLETLHEKVGLDDDAEASSPTVDFGEGVDPLSTDDELDVSADRGSQTVDDGHAVDHEPAADTAVSTQESATTGEAEQTVGESASVTAFDTDDLESATADADADILDRLDALEDAVEQQTVLLERQQNT